MTYRTCVGCYMEKEPCPARDHVRRTVKGLGVTSIKWRCSNRVPRIAVGDPVWAETVADLNSTEIGDDGYPLRHSFPAIAIANSGSKMIVFIDPGVASLSDGVFFNKDCSGFCKVSLSRITAREGERVEVCRHCSWPAPKGHQTGYVCNPDPIDEVSR